MSTALLEPAPDFVENRWDKAESQPRTEQRVVPMEDIRGNFSFQEEFDIEVDYGQTRFPVEGDVAVHVADPINAPVRLGYRDATGTLEVIDWGLEIPLEQSGDLPRLIGRRFLELYSKAVTGYLHDEERDWLKTISKQMDYHSFAAARKLPRYREATLIRKAPALLLQFLEEKNVRLDTALVSKLHTLNEGDRFGAWFTLDGNGTIVDFQHVLLLPTVSDLLADIPLHRTDADFPEHLTELLPSPRQ